jgi:hypothetical protein
MEVHEQIVVVKYCAARNYPIFAIPNGGSRNKIEAVNLKRQGVKAGVPDLFLPVANHGKHGLFIEMKYGKGRTSPAQKEWIELLRENGYAAEVCYGASEAIDLIEKYLTRK